MASASGALCHTLLLLLLLLMASISPTISMSHVASQPVASQPVAAMKPVSGLKPMVLDEMLQWQRRRRLNSFRICALCTCCGGPRGLCLPSPCCYAINCNIPNRPFGFCSFTPKTCNCFGCHL